MMGLRGRYLELAVLALGLPVAVLGALLPVNEYGSLDIDQAGIVDCDGPLGVLIFAIPAMVFYGAAALRAIYLRRTAMRWHLGVAAICSIMCLCVAPNLVQAIAADTQNDASEACA